jgi:hypothetical protein
VQFISICPALKKWIKTTFLILILRTELIYYPKIHLILGKLSSSFDPKDFKTPPYPNAVFFFEDVGDSSLKLKTPFYSVSRCINWTKDTHTMTQYRHVS